MFHLVFTPHDLSGYEFGWLERYDKYIVAKEYGKKEKHLHFHILIDTDVKVETVRDMAKSRLHIPPGQRGKESKYYALFSDWKDPGYICKSNDVQAFKGFSEKEIMEFVISGKNKYPGKLDSSGELSGETAPAARKPKQPRVPYQQQVIAIASAEWYKYKKECKDNDYQVCKHELIEMVCKAMREVSRGINEYLLKDLCNAILFDDLDFRSQVLQRLKSKMDL